MHQELISKVDQGIKSGKFLFEEYFSSIKVFYKNFLINYTY